MKDVLEEINRAEKNRENYIKIYINALSKVGITKKNQKEIKKSLKDFVDGIIFITKQIEDIRNEY